MYRSRNPRKKGVIIKIKVWDSYAMNKEREVQGAEAEEILSAAQVFSHEMPKISKNNILRIHPIFMSRDDKNVDDVSGRV